MASLSSKNNETSVDPSRVWIYHERQESLLCGQHALNNLVQSSQFAVDELAQIAQELDALELQFMAASNEGGMQSREYQQRLQEGSVNVDERGNFSIQVLKTCLNRYFAIKQQQQQHHGQLSHDQGDWLPHLTDSVLKDRLGLQDITQVTAFLLHKSDHWLAIRQVAGRFFNFNSTLERPVPISHFELGTQLSQAAQPGATGGYTVFCVAAPSQWLPPPHIGDYPPPTPSSSIGGGTWHNMANLLKATPQFHNNALKAFSSQQQLVQSSGNPNTATTLNKPRVDPWTKVTGAGRRLDGKSTVPSSSSSMNMAIEGLTEEEQLQLAMQLSSQPPEPVPTSTSSQTELANLTVSEEPLIGAPDTCRIQFRFMGKTSSQKSPVLVRRFPNSALVQVLYLLCHEHYLDGRNDGMDVELRAAASFPPRNLDSLRNQTLQEASLIQGETIQVRIISKGS